MPTITPCLWFDTQAEEAAAFYTSVFPRSRVTGIARYGPDEPGPEGEVMLVEFELDGQPFQALNGGPEFTFSEAISLSIGCTSQDEVDEYWSTLSKDGEEGPCGWLKDRFGLSWQVVPLQVVELLRDGDAERRNRVMQAVLTMRKIDVAEIERAAAG